MNREATFIPSNESAWLKLVGEFRQVCVLKRAGMKEESDRILSEVLPSSISAWSRMESSSIETKRQKLQEMFIAEERKTAGVWSTPTPALAREMASAAPTIQKDSELKGLDSAPPVVAKPKSSSVPPPLPLSALPSIAKTVQERPRVLSLAVPEVGNSSAPAVPANVADPRPALHPAVRSIQEDTVPPPPLKDSPRVSEGDAFRIRIQPSCSHAVVPSLGETFVTQVWQAPDPFSNVSTLPIPSVTELQEEDPFKDLASSLDRVLAPQKSRSVLSVLFRNE